MAELLGGMRAVKGSMTYRAISFLKAQLKVEAYERVVVGWREHAH
jgi:hypothetical protein